MRKKFFTIFDSKVNCYLEPFTARSAAEAIRMWADTINGGKSLMAAHPGDFTLFEIAEYNEETGIITPHAALVSLGNGFTVRKQEPVSPSPLRASSGDELGSRRPLESAV